MAALQFNNVPYNGYAAPLPSAPFIPAPPNPFLNQITGIMQKHDDEFQNLMK